MSTSCPSPESVLHSLLNDSATESKLAQHLPSCQSCSELAEQLQSLLATRIPDDTQSGHGSLIGKLLADVLIVSYLGAGASSVVYKALHLPSRMPVAVKFLSSQNPHNIVAWRREARTFATVKHPHLLSIIAEHQLNGYDFFVLEYAPLGSLADRLRLGRMAPTQAAALVRDVAAGCAALHEHGIVHRDIKPSNALLFSEQLVKLSDFGIARALDETVITNTGMLVGTPSYMSPEQFGIIDAPLGRASDVWSIGAVLYTLVAGKPPFAGKNTVEIVANATRGVIAPSKHALDLPRDLETICLKCLQQQPDWRYPTATEVVQDLENYLAGKSVTATRSGLRTPTFLQGKGRRRRTAMLTSVAVLLAGGLIGRHFLAQPRDGVDEQPITTPEPDSKAQRDVQAALDRIQQLGGSVRYFDEQVDEINFNSTNITDADLAGFEVFRKLRGVLLDDTQVSIAGIKKLPPWVYRIDLGKTQIGDNDCEELAKISNARGLAFVGNSISDTGVALLAHNELIEELTLQETQIGDAAIASLLRCQKMRNLVLNSSSRLTAPAIATLGQLTNLQQLHLANTAVDDAAIESLLSQLQLNELGLSRCEKLTDRCLRALAANRTIQSLFIDGNRFSNAALADLRAMPQLRKLYARGMPLVDYSQLKRDLPDITLVENW